MQCGMQKLQRSVLYLQKVIYTLETEYCFSYLISELKRDKAADTDIDNETAAPFYTSVELADALMCH